MHVIVLGSGAAAYGAVLALERHSWLKITVVDIGEPAVGPLSTDVAPRDWSGKHWRDLYSYLRRAYGLGLLPPKTNFGVRPAQREVANWGKIWHSSNNGGLASFWGLSSLPFDDADFDDWPISAQEMRPHYRAVANDMGLASTSVNSRNFAAELVNRPPPPIALAARRLMSALRAETPVQCGVYRVSAVDAVLALETRADHGNYCTGCGECMIGCYRGAMFSPRDCFAKWEATGRITRVCGRALRVEPNLGEVDVLRSDGARTQLRADLVFVCAGTIASAEIALRSLPQVTGIEVVDNAVWTFPIIAPRSQRTDSSEHVALTSGLLAMHPLERHLPQAQVQIYPTFEHMWRNVVPVVGWRMVRPFGRLLYERLLWGRIFVDASCSQAYALTLNSRDDLSIELARPPARADRLQPLWESIQDTFQRAGYRALKLRLRHATSSHYQGGLPLGEGVVDRDGFGGERLVFCDALVFPMASETSPTLTIMANAHRIAGNAIEQRMQ
jgi:choline dehydrogenase-like flavoprotein